MLGERQLQPLAQLGGLLAVERELGDAQLGERAAGAQTLGRQRRIGAAGQHEAQLLGGVADEEVDRGGCRGAGELVNLIEHQHERRAQLGEAVDQQREEALGAGSRRRDEAIERAAGLERSRAAQCAQEVLEQPIGVIVLAVERQPAGGAGQRARRDPRGEQHGLAGAGRRGEQHDASSTPSSRVSYRRPRSIRWREGGGINSLVATVGIGAVRLGWEGYAARGVAERGAAARAGLDERGSRPARVPGG